MELSIIIVNYNTCRLTCDAIQSVLQSVTAFAYEVIIVDNHSTDSSVETITKLFPEVCLIKNEENVGFAKANNQAIAVSSGKYILLLNSDTIIKPDTLQVMVSYMNEHPKVGASGCKVMLPDGSLDKACKRGFPTPSASFYYLTGLSKIFPNKARFNMYQLTHLDPDQSYQVDCLVGAFMVVRSETIKQVGLLDEEFFMYGEDVDWCYRIKQSGWEIIYYPYTSIIHYKGASSKRKPYKIVYEFHRAMYLFHKKHYQKRYPLVVNLFVYGGIVLKLLLAMMQNARKRLR
ncbi:glycosyltransferase family 2 protein [Brevibacillus sp. Leaf182]|uniref:glycosyltransferase family 2 protein n=1 Tax=Brevibacillus sp. Leaf182 TaxID=1736290 RepID=UPI0006F8F839|nr:glycosyltransferase family 2 protein [Brevibacillus sp. Leaf182]RAT98743.1 glycosyltransferase family 2 protein [Brevibacillus sp. Leaf182]